jgi:thioredoxin-dependent peroxiredoxin
MKPDPQDINWCSIEYCKPQRSFHMGLRINDIAPDFTAESTQGKISLHDWIGDSYAILFSHPKDFTPVCTTEFGAVAQLAGEFEARNTKVMGVSVDSVEDHKKWIRDIEAFAGVPANFPIIDDVSLTVAKLYDMLPAEAYLPDGRTPADSATVRTVFIIGPDKKVRLTMTYPMSVGRNFAEVLRALDAVRATDGVPIATPANWVPGQDVIAALSLNDAAAEAKFGKLDIKLPYLRFAKAPK